MNIVRDCPFFHKEGENVKHLFKACNLAYTWSTINSHCPNPDSIDLHLID